MNCLGQQNVPSHAEKKGEDHIFENKLENWCKKM